MRAFFKVQRAGSGTRARYSSMVFGAPPPFIVEPRLLGLVFFMRGILTRRYRSRFLQLSTTPFWIGSKEW